MDGRGIDSEGHEFNSAEEMWRDQIGNGDPLKKSQWYSQGVGYWQVLTIYLQTSFTVLILCKEAIFRMFWCLFVVVWLIGREGCGGYCGWSVGRLWACK